MMPSKICYDHEMTPRLSPICHLALSILLRARPHWLLSGDRMIKYPLSRIIQSILALILDKINIKRILSELKFSELTSRPWSGYPKLHSQLQIILIFLDMNNS